MFLNLEDFEEVEEAPKKFSEDYLWTMIEEGDWISSGKWEYQTCVVMNNESGKYYKYELYRSGSYYSDHYYKHMEDDDGVELLEVKPVEKTVVVKSWECV